MLARGCSLGNRGIRMTNENLEIKKEAEELQRMYKEDPRSETFNAIVYGGLGSGKTFSLKTARRPVLIHSFDPGGTMSIRDEINDENPTMFADIRFESEDPNYPQVFKEWDEVYHDLKRKGIFDRLGTFVIDSATTWAQSAMWEILRMKGRAGTVRKGAGQKGTGFYGVPFEEDWLPQMAMLEKAMRDFVSLPCDCILTGHDDSDKDGVTGKMFIHLMITGKLQKRIPLLFSEIYHASTTETSDGLHYRFLTRATGLYQARTRLGKGGELDLYEEQNFKSILEKVGMSTEDKPSLLED